MVNKKYYFVGQKLPFKCVAANRRFAVCVRPLSKKFDRDFLEFEVAREAYCSVDEAWKYLKNDRLYTIIDFKNHFRGPHNAIFNMYDFKKPRDLQLLLNDLQSNRLEISKAKGTELDIDWVKTENPPNEIEESYSAFARAAERLAKVFKKFS